MRGGGHTRGVRTRIVVPLLIVATVLACTSTVPGTPSRKDSVVTKEDPGGNGGVDPSFVHNTDGGEIDRLAAAVITDVLTYWKQTFPSAFGSEWKDLEGGFYSVDTADEDADAPPCAKQSSDVEGNAYYCPSEDVIAWDRAALLPVLKERFGESAVMLVLAHEIGHAVQRRAGLTIAEQRRNRERYPTILVEAQADCYAGTFVRWVADGRAEHLQSARDRLDSALGALVSFRDPIGTEQTEQGAHGDAFDRVSAFQDGFDNGVKLCAEMSVDNRRFTQRGFIDIDDAQRGGNLPFDKLLESIVPDIDAYFAALVSQRGKQWSTPQIRTTETDPTCTNADQGPIAYCKDAGGIDVAVKGELPELHADIGDYATGTMLASRFGMAAMSILGRPLDGADAQREVLCLAGAYTGTVLGRQQGFLLSPGDLDEAVQVLLRFDYAGRDGTGKAIATGFERVSVFRAGTLQGVDACKLS